MEEVKQVQSYSYYGKGLDRQMLCKQNKEQLEKLRKKSQTPQKEVNLYMPLSESKQRKKQIINKQSPKTNDKSICFKSINRTQSPGFFHQFQQEKSYEPKYNPKFEVVQPRLPSFTIQKADFTRQISEIPNIPEDQYNKEYVICSKNPLVHKENQNVQLNRISNTVSTKSPGQSFKSSVWTNQNTINLKRKDQGDISNNTQIDWSALNDLELTNYEIRKQSDQTQEKKWIQFDKQVSRIDKQVSRLSQKSQNCSPNNLKNEIFLNNFKMHETDKYKTHDFNSYTQRPEVFPPRHSPNYNLLDGVNYDRLLPRKNKGYTVFGKYPNFINNKFDNMDPSPMGRLNYPEKEKNFYQQNVAHTFQVDLGKLTDRKDREQFWPNHDHGIRTYYQQLLKNNYNNRQFRSHSITDNKFFQNSPKETTKNVGFNNRGIIPVQIVDYQQN